MSKPSTDCTHGAEAFLQSLGISNHSKHPDAEGQILQLLEETGAAKLLSRSTTGEMLAKEIDALYLNEKVALRSHSLDYDQLFSSLLGLECLTKDYQNFIA